MLWDLLQCPGRLPLATALSSPSTLASPASPTPNQHGPARHRTPHLQALLKEKTQNTIQVFEKLKETKASLKEEQGRRAMAEQALEAQRQEVARAQAAAAAAAESARSAQAQAAAAARAADGARADAAAARQQLSAVQAQLQRLQAVCDSMQAQVAGSAAVATQQAQQLPGPEAAALQGQLEALQAEQAAMQQQLQRWQSALTPFAMAAASLVGGDAGAAAAAAAAVARPAAGLPLPAPVAAPAAAPAQGRRRGGGAAGPAVAGSTAAPTSPRQPRGKAAQQKEQKDQRQREAGEAEAQRRAALLAAAAPEKPEDVRARAVAARQAAAAAGAAGAGMKRPRTGPDGFGAAPAQVDVLAEALALPAKRARQAAPAAGGAAAGGASPRSQPAPQQQQQRGAAAGAPTAAAAAPPAEASLAISANELAVEQQREQLTAADEAAQLLGRIAAGSGGDGSVSEKVVHYVAAQLQLMHAERRLPLPLLLACFETAVLECAEPKPQPHRLQSWAAAVQDAQPRLPPATRAAPSGWFGQAQQAQPAQQQATGGEATGGGSGVLPFAPVWCTREAFTSHRLHWLLHCAAHVQHLQQQYAAAQVALGKHPAQQCVAGFAEALQQHLHRLVVRCCMAGSPHDSTAGRKGSSSVLRHTETEVCALAAAAAGLCRVAGDAHVSLGVS